MAINQFERVDADGSPAAKSTLKGGAAEEAPSREKQGFKVRYGVIDRGDFEIISDDNARDFETRMRQQSAWGVDQARTLKNGADVQQWLNAMNQALQFRREHNLSGSYWNAPADLPPEERAELLRLDRAIKEFEVKE